MKNNLVITIILVLVVGGGAFYGGMRYQESRRPAFNRQFNGTGMRNGGQAGLQNNRPVNGEIIAADDKSITVKMQDGSSKIVLITTATTINKAAEGTKDDLKTGERVAVFGSTNSDGSVTAQNVQLNPMFRGSSGGGTPGN